MHFALWVIAPHTLFIVSALLLRLPPASSAMRRLFVLLTAVIAGCTADSSAADRAGQATEQATDASSASAAVPVPTGGPVAAVDGERQRLSTAQLLPYFPETAGRFTRSRLGSVAELDTRDASGAVVGLVSTVTVAYNLTERGGIRRGLNATVNDMIDDPSAVERARKDFEEKRYAGMYDGYDGAKFTAGSAAGLATQEITTSVVSMVRLIVADRFLVQVQRTSSPVDPVEIADLVAFIEASALPRLAKAPAFADAGTPPIPEWAAAEVAVLEAAAAERASAEQVTAAAAAAEVAAAGELLPCDEILSAADVAEVLGVTRVAVRPTPGIEKQGRNCNRSYKPSGGPAGVVLLIISHFRRADQATGALRVASDHDGKLDLQPLAGGLTGVRYTHRHSFDTHVSHFAIGTDFVELKAEAPGERAPGITPAQLATLTAIVARKLER